MEAHLIVRAVLGIAITLVLLAFALKRGWFLVNLARAGKAAPGRTDDAGKRVEAEATEVLGQRKLLKWTVPGIAHVFAFWGFLILGITVVTAFGELIIENFSVQPERIQSGQCVNVHWSLGGGGQHIRLTRNGVPVLDHGAPSGQLQDCLAEPISYIFRLEAFNHTGMMVAQERSVTVQAPPLLR